MEILKISEFNWLTKFGILKLDENNKSNQDLKKNFWVPNHLSANCFECEVKFSTFVAWQHHCRICGNIFCDNCSSKTIQMTIKNKAIKLRVCNNCFNISQNFSLYIEKKFIKDEIKEDYFYNAYEQARIKNDKFVKFENVENENKIKDNINNLYELILKNLINNVLDEYFNKSITLEWGNTLFLLIKEVINNLRTNSLFLNDSLNINKFIKIKIIPYKDNSECKVISGFVMKKSFFSKNTQTSYTEPKILLINLERDFILKKLDNITNSVQRSNAYINILERKIQISKADIILIGKNYPKLLLSNIKNNNLINNKCFIFDVKKNSFENIARCTENIILPSFDLIGTDNILGRCKNFYVKNLKYNFIYNKIDIELNKNEQKYLVVFEGSNPLLFNTILISGEDKMFLRKIKNILRNILLPTARDLYLQKYLLYTFNLKIENINDEKICGKEIYSIFEENKGYRPKELDQEPTTIKDYDLNKSLKVNNNISKELKLRKTLEIVNRLLTKDYNKERKSSKKLFFKEHFSNFFYKGFDLAIICKKCEYINYSLIKITKKAINNQIFEENNLEMYEDDEYISISHSQSFMRNSAIISKPKIEKNVHKNIGKYCGYPSKLFLSFFCDNKKYDKPLGKFIFELCKESETNCLFCGIQLSKHIHHLYKSNGRIKMKLITEKENNLDKIINYLNINNSFKINNKIPEKYNTIEIYTYGFCNICQDITTPLFKLSNEILNYSITKFFRFSLENLKIENNFRDYDYNIKNIMGHNICNHYINKDISRIFVSNYGCWVFEYDSLSKYFISPLNINNKINIIENNGNKLDNNNLIEQYMNEANNNSKIILDMLYNLFQKQITGLEKLLNDEKLYLFKTSINLLINIIIMTMRLIEDFKLNILSKYLNKEYISSNNNLNLLKYIIIIKKIYLKIIQIKIIANTIDKYIIEINVISDILNNKIPISYEENVNLLEGKNEDIPIELQLFDIKIDKSPKININFEKNETYLKILSFIEYYDDKHNNYSCEFINHDLSCIISTALSSDDYLNYIKKDNKDNIQFSNIKCKRTPNELKYDDIKKNIYSKKNNVIYINMFKNKDRKDFEEVEKKQFQQKKTYFDNSLIFDLSKNTFYDNNNNKEKNILQFLEKELISDNKEVFIYILSNNFCNLFDNKNKMFKYSSKEIKRLDKKEENENKINDIMEINGITKEMNNIKNSLSEFNNLFIEQQRELNVIIKSLLIQKEKKKSNYNRTLSHSSKNLQEDIENSNKKNVSRKSSSSSKNSSEDEFEPKSFNTDNNNLLNVINENNNSQSNIIPSFPFIPEFLKIFELKTPKYYEEEILEKKYPEFKIKVYFPYQFEALRTTFCANNEEFIESIRKSFEWSVTGGKSNANFFKSFDNKYIIKNISEMEFNMFIESGLNYFKHICKFLFYKKASAIGIILGAYSIKVKMPGEKDKHYYLILMENIYYDMLTDINNFNSPESNIKVYDLKGSKINRYIQQERRKPGKVLLDTNFLEDFNGEPLFLDFNVFQILQNALNNDSQFLKDEGIIDYSLLVIFEYDNNCNNKSDTKKDDNNFKKIRLGIIDYLRKYTWDKQIESYSKKFINGFSNPTIINPDSYCKRFMDKFQRYFVGI